MIMRVITFVSDDGYNVDVTGEFVELKSEYHSNKYGTRRTAGAEVCKGKT